MHQNLYNTYLKHHGVKGQKWGVRRYQNEDGTKIQNGKKNVGLLLGGTTVGALAVGTAWYLKSQHSKKVLHQKRVAAAAKANATKAARRASGMYQSFKNVDVSISKGTEFVKTFSNVKIAKILT